MNKAAAIIISIGLVVGLGIIFMNGPASRGSRGVATEEAGTNTEIKDGVLYITITADGGYWPRVTTVPAGMPTKLIVTTDGTYDCSAALVIPSVGFQKTLAATGQEIIDIGTPEPGQELQGVCGMGMYGFKINFS